jgi:hypothetical protein
MMQTLPMSRLPLMALLPVFLWNSDGAASPVYTCPKPPEKLQDRQAYTYEDGEMNPLTSMEAFEAAQRTRRTLYFVVKSDVGERKGVLIIKTARFGPEQANDRPRSNQVRLLRKMASSCDSSPSYRGTVSTQAYEAYHDRGNDRGGYLEDPAGNTSAIVRLSRFHTQYEATGYASNSDRCRLTSDKNGADGAYEARNNRSQFSFVPHIVDKGMSGAAVGDLARLFTWAGTLIVPPARAKGHVLRERRVEIKPYQTTAGIACVPFNVKMRAKAQVLRINDLDRRNQIGFDWPRVPEFRIGPTEGGEP